MTNEQRIQFITDAVNHVRQQGCFAMVISTEGLPICQYRTPDGKSCAIGGLIPDELYDRDMESRVVGSVIDNFPKVRAFFQDKYGYDHKDDAAFILFVQIHAHDRPARDSKRQLPVLSDVLHTAKLQKLIQ